MVKSMVRKSCCKPVTPCKMKPRKACCAIIIPQKKISNFNLELTLYEIWVN